MKSTTGTRRTRFRLRRSDASVAALSVGERQQGGVFPRRGDGRGAQQRAELAVVGIGRGRRGGRLCDVWGRAAWRRVHGRGGVGLSGRGGGGGSLSSWRCARANKKNGINRSERVTRQATAFDLNDVLDAMRCSVIGSEMHSQ